MILPASIRPISQLMGLCRSSYLKGAGGKAKTILFTFEKLSGIHLIGCLERRNFCEGQLETLFGNLVNHPEGVKQMYTCFGC
jgi:hypothetical protein